jgi:hypothetical protein
MKERRQRVRCVLNRGRAGRAGRSSKTETYFSRAALSHWERDTPLTFVLFRTVLASKDGTRDFKTFCNYC